MEQIMKLRGDPKSKRPRNYWTICCIGCINKTNLSIIFLKKNFTFFKHSIWGDEECLSMCCAMVCMFRSMDNSGELLSQLCVIWRWNSGHQAGKQVPLLLVHPPALSSFIILQWQLRPPTKGHILKSASATGDRKYFEDMLSARSPCQSCLPLYLGLLGS